MQKKKLDGGPYIKNWKSRIRFYVFVSNNQFQYQSIFITQFYGYLEIDTMFGYYEHHKSLGIINKSTKHFKRRNTAFKILSH